MSATPAPRPAVVLGVDTHRDAHVAAALDTLGRRLDVRSVPTTPAGYAALLAWARALGDVTRVGVEGTGAYGAARMRARRDAGVAVIEVNRPDRVRRRRLGKSDPTNAEHAAHAARAGGATVTPKAQDGAVEALRLLTVARCSAVKARTRAGNQLRCLLVTAPATLRATLARGTLAAQANRALWTIALVRARSYARTKAYVARRPAEGRSLREITRCLKRYLVREIYPLLLADLAAARHLVLT